jgi:hypothetical protein
MRRITVIHFETNLLRERASLLGGKTAVADVYTSVAWTYVSFLSSLLADEIIYCLLE